MPQVSGDAPILATKLFVPPPRERLVPRARLRDRLAATRGGRVTLIAAAAGWGKSTLLADWALEAPGRVAWLSLDAADDEPRRFLSYVIAALRAADAVGADEMIEPLASTTDAVRAAATELLNEIARRGGPVSLVLDDYHTIESRAVHDVMQFLIEHIPPNFQIIIATRVDPPLALSRLRARGLLLELRGDDLRFTTGESGAFLNGAMGLTLDTREVAELERRTEGWVVGLQMAAISLAGRDRPQAFIEHFSGSNRYVLDYLTDEVLDRQRPEVREFLLATSILTRLSGPLCDAVLERSGSESILEELDAANLFLIPLDDVRYFYRYHHLFASLLQHHLTRTHSPVQIADLHRRASAWYDANRMPEVALEHALAAKDFDAAVRIVGAHSLNRTLGGDMASVVRWFDMLPQERIERDIQLSLSRSMALLGDWQLPRAYETAVKAAALVTGETPPAVRGAVLAIRGTLERTVDKFDEGNANLHRAMELAEGFWRTLAQYQLGLIPLHEADAGRAVRTLEPACVRPSRADQALIPVLAATFTAYAEWWRGNPDRAVALAHELFEWIDVAKDVVQDRPLDCLPNAVLAEVHCSWNQLEAARAFGDRAMKHARSGIMLGLFESARSFAHVALAQRDWDAAARAAGDLQRAVRNVGVHFYWTFGADALYHLILFRRWQANGDRNDFATVQKWSRAVEEQLDRRRGGFYRDSPLVLTARVMIEEERYSDALAILDAIAPEAVRTERLILQIELAILRSILEARRGHAEDAIASMRHALSLAAGPRYVRLFLDEGDAIQPIVERAGGTITFDASPARPAPRAVSPDALSDRELEVLKLIASGASNQDAARKLFIAASTVKKHLENIYAKLQAGGRVEAVGRAREMGLIQ
jgi:LuxR family transcriptional regulator, maltose regulon positive regulatory protein